MARSTNAFRPLALVAPVLLLLAACGGADAETRGGGLAGDAQAAEAPSGPAEASAGDPAELAERGEEVFRAKGCNACHKLGGGRLVGPDLVGVTDRRERAWIEAMIQRPDSMLRHDPEAKALLATFYTPMQDVGVTREQAAALYHYLRRETERAGGAGQ